MMAFFALPLEQVRGPQISFIDEETAKIANLSGWHI